MKIKIDEKEIMVNDSNKNIVDIAADNGITILAPCYRNKKKHGCCNACMIEIDNEINYACGTKPKDGMEIIYDRPDLDVKRKEQLEKYVEAIRSNDISQNSCSTQENNCSQSNETSCCSSNTSCC